MIGNQIGHVEIIELQEVDRCGEQFLPKRLIAHLDRLGACPKLCLRQYIQKPARRSTRCGLPPRV